MIRLASLLVITIAVAAPLPSQCNKPALPATGLLTATKLNVSVTYSDGYKTLANLTHPSGTVPSCGWPLIVHVHGYGGRRSVQRGLASRGFAVVTYDVRGQGNAKTLNPTTKGMTFYGPVEKYDLAEIIAFARKTWKSLVSQTKVGVTGASQGGIHSWFAAAYSGKKITVPGRGTITFPAIDAVVPQNFVPDIMQHSLRGGTLFAIDALNRAFGGNTGAVLDATLRANFRTFFLNQDPQGLLKKLNAEAGRPVEAALIGTKVPILFQHGWLDGIQTPREAVRTLGSLTTSPVRAMLSTIGHGSPPNNYEAAFREQLRVRWFDRFLWDIANRVDKEAPAVPGLLPTSAAALTNRASLWNHRFDASWQPKDASASRLFLRGNGQLQTTAAAGSDTTIRHTVRNGYTAQRFASSLLQLRTATILANTPLSQRVFSAAPLASQRELAGSPRISMNVVPSASRFHLTALLMARMPGTTRDAMLSSWGRGVIGAKANQAMRLTFDMAPIYSVLPRGTILRIVIRNHWLREWPMQRRIVTAPYFVACDTKLRHGTGNNASYVDLPFRNQVGISLVTAMTENRVSRLQDATLGVRAGVARGSRPYILAGSLSGHVPGTPLPGGTLPINWDPVSDFVLTLALSNSTLVPGFTGTLNQNGVATATARFSNLSNVPTALVGQRLTFAAWVYASATDLTGSSSNPVDIVFR